MSRGIVRSQAAKWVKQSLQRVVLLAQAFGSAHHLAVQDLMQIAHPNTCREKGIRQGEAPRVEDATIGEQFATHQVSHCKRLSMRCDVCNPTQQGFLESPLANWPGAQVLDRQYRQVLALAHATREALLLCLKSITVVMKV